MEAKRAAKMNRLKGLDFEANLTHILSRFREKEVGHTLGTLGAMHSCFRQMKSIRGLQ